MKVLNYDDVLVKVQTKEEPTGIPDVWTLPQLNNRAVVVSCGEEYEDKLLNQYVILKEHLDNAPQVTFNGELFRRTNLKNILLILEKEKNEYRD